MILHPQTANDLERLCSNPPHAILIGGEEGAGKSSLALQLAQRILGRKNLTADSSFRHYIPIKGSIGIEVVRDLQKFLYLKTTGAALIRRVIVVESAHLMTHEAQNALLKILEEPPADTVTVLTAIPNKSILPTIYSRVQQISIKAPSLEQSEAAYTKQGYKSADIQRAYGLSNGQQGLLKALLEQSTEHELVDAITLAKALLSKTRFERLAMIDELSKQKSGVPHLLKALKRIARSGLKQAAKQGKGGPVKNWHNILENVQETEKLLAHNPNTKLLLTNLMLKI